MDYTRTKRVLTTVLLLNLFVAVLKLVFGMLAGSIAMVSDGIHSLFDTSSNIIGLVSISIASKPADADHPYGHRKYEIMATMVIGALIIFSAFQIIEGVLGRLINPVTPGISFITIAVMVGTLVINYLVSRYEYRIGHVLGSSILIADSLHTRSDVYASLGVLIGFGLVILGYPVADSLVALLIVLLIVKTGYRILRQGSDILCDTCVIDTRQVKEVAESVNGVESCHKIRSRGMHDDIYLDMHIVLDKNITLEKGHKITHQMTDAIKKKFQGIRDVTVHMEPD